MISLILSLALSSNGWAQPTKPTPSTTAAPSSKSTTTTPPKKTGSSTEIFEKEDEEESADPHAGLKTLNAKVKVVRDDGEGREVFFTSDKVTGAFYLRRSVEHYGKYLKALENSKKPQGAPVTIRYDENQNIKSVEGISSTVAPSDSDEKWNFSEVPE